MKAIEAKQVEDEAWNAMRKHEQSLIETPAWKEYARLRDLWYDSKKLREALETLEGRQ